MHPKHFDIEEMVRVARNRDKAMIGLPPGIHDASASAVFIVSSESEFQRNPVRFDKVISTDNLVDLDIPTDQVTGVMDDQIVVQVSIPDLHSSVRVIKEVHGLLEGVAIIGGWLTSRLINQFIRNLVVIEVQKVRLARAKRLARSTTISLRTVARAQVREVRIGVSLLKRNIRHFTLSKKLLNPLRLVRRVGVKVVIRGFLLIGLAVDILIIGHAIVQGTGRAGVAGGIGALVGGLAETLTFGLIEEKTTQLGLNVEGALSEMSFFGDLNVRGVTLGTGI